MRLRTTPSWCWSTRDRRRFRFGSSKLCLKDLQTAGMCLSRHGNSAPNQWVERERMRAVSRCRWLLAAGALAIASAPALAQEAPATTNAPTTTAPPPSDSVGPKGPENFSLNGTVTRPADQPAARPGRRPANAAGRSTTPPVQPSDQPAATPARRPRAGRDRRRRHPLRARLERPRSSSRRPPDRAAARARTAASVRSLLRRSRASLPALGASGSGSSRPLRRRWISPRRPGTLAPEHSIPLLPWLLAALALGLGGGFLFWRNRARAAAYAGGPEFDLFAAPEPEPAPTPAPQLPRAAPVPPAPDAAPAPKPASPESFGVVSSRLRPWIELGFNPTRCVLDEQALTVEFELELFNSGSVPARGVRVDARSSMPGPTRTSRSAPSSPVRRGRASRSRSRP